MKNKSIQLVHLAFAGISVGLLTAGCASSEGRKKGSNGDSASINMDAKESPKPRPAWHECKGQNSCKGMGSCAVSQRDLEDLAFKAGIPMEKAGRSHGCKGRNECKGLGGCKS